jgi:hypothetical protein
MYRTLLACSAIVLMMSACSSNQKKIIIFSKGTTDINKEALTIKATDGAGHEEQNLNLVGESITLNLNSPAGEAKATLTENGVYVINVKTDTIIGSQVTYSAPDMNTKVITQEALKQKIDSLQQLVQNKNVSAANKNFFILPNTAAFLTNNYDAIIVGPFHRMTSAEEKDGKAPEVYRFYSIKEVRETIAKLEGMTSSSKTTDSEKK